MKATEAFNHMKRIINNGMRNNYSVNNVYEGLEEYIRVIVEGDNYILKKQKN